jgi:tetratricopeptide (TPR) repeat protein
MKLAIPLVIATLSVAGAAAAAPAKTIAPADPARLVATQRALDRAKFDETPAALLQARGAFESMSSAQPKSSALHYWVAVADWRLAPRMKEPPQAERYVKDGITHATRALELDPSNAEALAIKVALQGMSIRFEPSLAMSLGPELESSMGRALGMAPKNPRVHFIDALNTLHKPEFVGGGADKALPKFEETIALFDAESVADSTAPHWGREDALLWAGQSAMKLGRHDQAIAFYQKTLEVNPKNGWVRNTLIPEAEKAAAAGDAAPKTETATKEKGKS